MFWEVYRPVSGGVPKRLQSWVKGFPDNKMAKAWKVALTMKPMKNVALAAEYEHPAEMERRIQMKENIKQSSPERKSFKQYSEDAQTDQLKDRQEREKEQLSKKHDAENDKDKLRLTRKSNAKTEGVSPEVMKTKEKILKDLKKKKKVFDAEYGDKADDVMHGTAMNQAKKHHKVAEGRFGSELQRQLRLEVFSM